MNRENSFRFADQAIDIHSNGICTARVRGELLRATVFADIARLAYNRQAFFERSKDYG